MSEGHRYLFPDTNIFLEFVFFDEIDWKAVAGGDATLVVVTRPVIKELDRAKNEHRSQKKRERARTALRKIEEHQKGDAKLRNAALFEVWAKNPKVEEGIDAEYADDLLIACALNVARERNADVAIVTDDTGMRLRAAEFGLKVLELDEKLKRPHEQDELTIRLSKLEAQIAAKPAAKLVLTTVDGSLAVSKRIFRVAAKSNQEIDTQILSEIGGVHGLDQAPEASLESGWGARERSVLREQREYEQRQSITLELLLLLANSGSAPADDIHVTVSIPEVFTVTFEKQWAPVEKKSLVPAPARIRTPFGNWSKTSQTRATCRFQRVKQGMAQNLPPLYLTLRDAEFRGDATIEAMLNAGDPPVDERTDFRVRLTGH